MHFNLEFNIYSASASHAYPAIKRTQSLQLFVFSGLCSTLHGIICSRPALAATPTVTPPTSFIKIMHCMAAPKLGWCCLRLPPSLPHPLLTFFLALFHWSLCGKAREAAFCQCRSFRYFIFMKVVKRQRERESGGAWDACWQMPHAQLYARVYGDASYRNDIRLCTWPNFCNHLKMYSILRGVFHVGTAICICPQIPKCTFPAIAITKLLQWELERSFWYIL